MRPLSGLQLCRVGKKIREVKRRRVSFQQVKDLPVAKQPRTELGDEAVSAGGRVRCGLVVSIQLLWLEFHSSQGMLLFSSSLCLYCWCYYLQLLLLFAGAVAKKDNCF